MEASRQVHVRPSLERAHDDPAERQSRRRLRLYQELTVRGGVALVIVAFGSSNGAFRIPACCSDTIVT